MCPIFWTSTPKSQLPFTFSVITSAHACAKAIMHVLFDMTVAQSTYRSYRDGHWKPFHSLEYIQGYSSLIWWWNFHFHQQESQPLRWVHGLELANISWEILWDGYIWSWCDHTELSNYNSWFISTELLI